jgi:hypothetical protein
MLIVKASDGSDVVRLAIARAQFAVTLSTRGIRGGLKKHRALVFNVAGRAFGSECLIRVVERSIVTGEARSVGHLRGKRAGLRNMAERALLRKYRVSMREFSARIDFLAALIALCYEPSQRDHWDCH